MASSTPQEIQRQIFVDILRAVPEMSLDQLADLVQGRFADMAATVTVGDLLGASPRHGSQASARAGKLQGTPRRVGRPKGSKNKPKLAATDPTSTHHDPNAEATKPRRVPSVNTRTRAGRQRYEAALLRAITTAARPISAAELRTIAGGDDVQARRALNRLIDAGKVQYQGVARWTRYLVG